MNRCFFLAACLAFLTSASIEAQEEQPLSIGDRIAAIEVAHYLSGDPVASFDEDRVYVLTFWATASKYNRQVMPRLAELAVLYADEVTVIAVSDETVEVVKAFLASASAVEGQSWGDLMTFTVATDPDGSVKEEVFARAGQRQIPSSFVINGGRIEWIGHPLTLNRPLAEVVAGDWDRAAFKKVFDDDREAQKHWPEIRSLMNAANRTGDWKPLLDKVDEVLAAYPEHALTLYLKWEVLLMVTHDEAGAYALGPKLLEAYHDDAVHLHSMAGVILYRKELKTRDLDFALQAMQRANELSEYKKATALGALARAHLLRAELAEAVKYQRLAVEHSAADPELHAELERILKAYEAEAETAAEDR